MYVEVGNRLIIYKAEEFEYIGKDQRLNIEIHVHELITTTMAVQAKVGH